MRENDDQCYWWQPVQHVSIPHRPTGPLYLTGHVEVCSISTFGSEMMNYFYILPATELVWVAMEWSELKLRGVVHATSCLAHPGPTVAECMSICKGMNCCMDSTPDQGPC